MWQIKIFPASTFKMLKDVNMLIFIKQEFKIYQNNYFIYYY